MANIHPALEGLAVDIESLSLDPANARRHSARNLDKIKASLIEFGQRKPIVVRASTRTVEAGNGTLEVARALGWTKIAAVVVDDDALTATRYALADNRTAELAEWDQDVLAETLSALSSEGVDLDELGWSERDLRDVFELTTPLEDDGDEGSAGVEDFQIAFKIIVVCRDESEQSSLLTRLEAEGYPCQLLML